MDIIIVSDSGVNKSIYINLHKRLKHIINKFNIFYSLDNDFNKTPEAMKLK